MQPLSSTMPSTASRIAEEHAPTPRCSHLSRVQEGALLSLKVISVISAIAASILFFATGNPLAGIAAIGLTLLSVGLLTPQSTHRVSVVSYPTPLYQTHPPVRLLPIIPTPLFMSPIPGGHVRIPVGQHLPTPPPFTGEERIPVGGGGSRPLLPPFCPAPPPLVPGDGRTPVRNGGIAFVPDPSQGERRIRVGDGGRNTPPGDEGEQRVPVGRHH